MDFNLIPILGIISSLIITPAIVFGFIFLMRKAKTDVEKLKYQKEIIQLEMQKEELHLKTILEENKKYDKLLEDKIYTASNEKNE
jgi:hypothetical protein